jgi:hypothetical protein
VPGKGSPTKVPGAPNNGANNGGGGGGAPGTPTPRPTATPSATPVPTPTPIGTSTLTFRSSDVPIDASTGPQPKITSFVNVAGVTGQVRNITVAVRLTVADDSMLDSMRIINPATAPLTFGSSLYSDSSQPKLSGQDLGTNCTAFAGATTFDDRVGGGPLSSGSAPYAGAFLTNQTGTGLVGMANSLRNPSYSNGDWKLEVFFEAGGTGRLECWSVTITFDNP